MCRDVWAAIVLQNNRKEKVKRKRKMVMEDEI